MRKLVAAVLMMGVAALARPAHAEVTQGPHPNTVLSRGGSLIWYTGELSLSGRTFGELDAICRQVPVQAVAGWRAPSERELRTLMTEVPRQNAVTSWTELFLTAPAAMVPAIPPFVRGARLHPQIQLVSRDLYTYEGQPTSYDHVVRGRMYIIQWFDRWTVANWSLQRSITHGPERTTLGNMHRLLCVADRPG